MSWTSRLACLHRFFFRRRQIEQDLDEEVRAYFDLLIDRRMTPGLSRQEATRAARMEFDGPEQIKEMVREERKGMAFETFMRDIRYAWRSLRNIPGFTAVAVLTLGLGIGANTAIFSLIDAVMLRLLPVQHPEQLVLLTDPSESGVAVDTTEGGVRSILSYPEFEQLRLHNTVFSGLLAAQSDLSDLDVFPGGNPGAQPIKAHTQLVSGNFFQLMGVQPISARLGSVLR